jgi:hypothetical protein
MPLNELLPRILLLLGAGFFVANLQILRDFLRFMRLKPAARLTWRGSKPPMYGLLLSLGVVLGLLLMYKLFVQRLGVLQVFGEAMMFVYYGYAFPLSLKIGRGFYEDGIWADTGYLPYSEIGGLTWREGNEITLVVIHRMRHMARRLTVPQRHYGAARRLLRDKIAAHDIQFTGKGLDLGVHDDRDTA